VLSLKSPWSIAAGSVESVSKDKKNRKAANTGLGQRERTIENCRLSISMSLKVDSPRHSPPHASQR
jgi:hypothetical protein